MNIVIAHFGTHYVGNSGGVEKVACDMANVLVSRGHHVAILYRDNREGTAYFPLDKSVREYNILFENGKQVVPERLPLPFRILRETARIFSKKAAASLNADYKGRQYGARIAVLLREIPADILISTSVQSTKYLVDAGVRAPVVQMIHSHPRTIFPTLSEAEKRAVAQCAVMQILLPSGMEMARQYFPGLPIRLIGNAVAPAARPAAPGAVKERHLITCVGSLTKNKRQKILCEAFGKLAESHPDWDVELWGYSGHYGSRVQSWIDDHHLSTRISIKGKTKDVADVYARSDIFCLPSVAEGFPLGLSEAMAAGVPVVGFKGTTGVEDLIEDGVSGLLAEEDSADSLAEKLALLMDSPAKRQEMGKHAREQMKQYAPEKIWNEWETLLQDVLNDKVE